MPINTDKLDLSRSLAGQDVAAAVEPVPPINPVFTPERMAKIGRLIKSEPELETQAEGGEESAPEAQAAAPAKADAKPEAKPAQNGDADVADTEVDSMLNSASLLSTKPREMFKKLAKIKDSYKQRAEKAEKEREELLAKTKTFEEELTKVKGVLPPDLELVRTRAQKAEELEKQNKDLLERLETVNLEHSPNFQNWWKAETSKHIELVKRHIPHEHREKIEKLLMEGSSPERDAAIDAILEPLPNSAKRIIDGAVTQLELTKMQREDALSKGSENYKKLVAKEREEQDRMRQQESERKARLMDKALAKAKQFTSFKPIDGDADHNAKIAERENIIRAIMSGQVDEDTMVAIPGRALDAIHYEEKVIPQLRAELEKANSLIKQLQASGPPSGGNAPKKGATTPSNPQSGRPGDFKSLQWVREKLAGTGT